MSYLKINSFITFFNGRNKCYGIVHTLNVNHAFIVYHNGMKITTTYKEISKCKEITRQEFVELIERKGDSLWYSSENTLKFYGLSIDDKNVSTSSNVVPKGLKYVEGEKVVLNGVTFKYDEYYKRLEVERDADDDDRIGAKVEVACPCCHGTKFTIGYGNYECIANCDCGHSMVVYDG